MKLPSSVPASVKAFLIAYGLFFTGLFLMMLSVLGVEAWHWYPWVAAFIRDVGLLLAAVVAGTILHENLLRGEMLRELVNQLDEKLEAKIPKTKEIASQTASEVHHLFGERPPRMTGLRLLCDVRRNSAGYYSWVLETKSQDLFFAGRSVLHRIDADIRSRIGGSAEEILLRRLKEGSKVNIVFLDPRIDILERLAAEEDQRLMIMLGDIAISIGVCRRLYELLVKEFRSLPTQAQLTIKIYDAVPYFAYHKQDDHVTVGFYFRSDVGSSSASYEVVDEKTKEAFEQHFRSIASGSTAKWLLEFDGAHGNHPAFNEDLFNELSGFMSDKLTKQKADELMNRR